MNNIISMDSNATSLKQKITLTSDTESQHTDPFSRSCLLMTKCIMSNVCSSIYCLYEHTNACTLAGTVTHTLTHTPLLPHVHFCRHL